jgi:hypothetical protein
MTTAGKGRNGSTRWRCRNYLSDYQRERNKTRPKRPWDPEKGLDARRRKLYGIGTEEWELLFDSQGRKCAICDAYESPQPWATDHDHSCCPGKKSCGACLRGILCSNCNVGIGHLRESPRIMRRAIAYLEGWAPEPDDFDQFDQKENHD